MKKIDRVKKRFVEDGQREVVLSLQAVDKENIAALKSL